MLPEQEGQGWISIEQVVVRMNTTYAPNGTFPIVLRDLSVPGVDGSPASIGYDVLNVRDVDGSSTSIGYDVAVCLQLFEPWIVDVYNGTAGLPAAMSLVGPGSVVQSVEQTEKQFGPTINDVIRQLNSSRLQDV